mgnify:CR=1 FL=1
MKRFVVIVSLLLFLAGCSTSTTPVAPTPVAPMPTPIVATATATLTITPTVIPSPTHTPTLTPTQTNTPTPTATSTPTATPTPTLTPTVALRYPAINLREPPDNHKREMIAVTFEWDDVGLREGDGYAVFVRRITVPTWEKTFYVGTQRKFAWGREQTLGYGEYVWTVFVLDSTGQIVSATGAERKFYWCHLRSGCQECSLCHR